MRFSKSCASTSVTPTDRVLSARLRAWSHSQVTNRSVGAALIGISHVLPEHATPRPGIADWPGTLPSVADF